MNKRRPDIKITLTRELFNSLLTMFAYYKATKNEIGETYYSRSADKLEGKIIRYGRFIKSETGDAVVVNFFSNEIIMLTDLFAKYINLREDSDGDYYANAEKGVRGFPDCGTDPAAINERSESSVLKSP